MKSQLKNRFSEFIIRKTLLNPEERVLVAVSGGLDSMVLLHLLLQWRHKFKIILEVIHLHHQIRGKTADEDAALVGQFCADHKIPIHILKHSVVEYAEVNKLSIEEAGHLLRKKLFEEFAAKNGFDKIVTGHHQDDQAETMLMRLIAGTGLQGLSGIRLKNEKWIRPLLFATRDEIRAYAEKNNIQFREDETNRDLSILRNKIRHHLLPLLKNDYDSTISAHLTQISGILEEWDTFLNTEIKKVSKKYLKQPDENKFKVGLPFFHLYFSWIKIHVLEYILTRLNQEKVKISYNQFSDFCYWVENGNIGSQFQWSSRIFSVKRARSINFFHSELNSEFSELIIHEPGKSYHLPNTNIQFSLEEVSKKNVRFSKNRTVEYISGDKLIFPLKIRHWKAGDYFKPLGLTSTKLVSDFLTDRKVGMPEKQNVHVLVREPDIVAIIGHQISEDYKLTDTTNQIYRLKILKEKK